MKMFEGDGADRAGVIGLIRQGFAGVGLEADQPDRDRVSSDQGFLIGRSGHDRSDQGPDDLGFGAPPFQTALQSFVYPKTVFGGVQRSCTIGVAPPHTASLAQNGILRSRQANHSVQIRNLTMLERDW